MKMPIPQYKTNKPSETPYAYDSKVVYCKNKLEDRYDEIDVQYFADHFEEMLNNIGFEWKHKRQDGTWKYPSADQIRNNWYHQHKWEECSQTYCDKKTTHNKRKANQVFDKGILSDTITDFKKIDRLNKRHEELEKLENNEIDHTYRKAKIEEEINSIWNRICARLGKDKEEQQSDEIMIIPNTPEHEDQHIRDIWTERARQDVMPR